MKIYLTGETGGIGLAIKEYFKDNNFRPTEEIDWVIMAHGVLNEEKIRDTFEVNVEHCIYVTQELIPRLKKGIIYISSTAGIRGNTKLPIYSASKAALNSYAQTMARKHLDLQFYALCPGPTNTKMWQSLGLEGKAQDPSEVAKAVQRIMTGEFKSGDIITVRNGVVTV